MPLRAVRRAGGHQVSHDTTPRHTTGGCAAADPIVAVSITHLALSSSSFCALRCSTIEVISCTGSTISIGESADTVTMDGGCKEMEVVITPALRERVKLVVTHDCSDIKLTVREANATTGGVTYVVKQPA